MNEGNNELSVKNKWKNSLEKLNCLSSIAKLLIVSLWFLFFEKLVTRGSAIILCEGVCIPLCGYYDCILFLSSKFLVIFLINIWRSDPFFKRNLLTYYLKFETSWHVQIVITHYHILSTDFLVWYEIETYIKGTLEKRSWLMILSTKSRNIFSISMESNSMRAV